MIIYSLADAFSLHNIINIVYTMYTLTNKYYLWFHVKIPNEKRPNEKRPNEKDLTKKT